jgi:formylmethanofuran dehydrogenase subunit C
MSANEEMKHQADSVEAGEFFQKAGLFMSALMECSSHKDFELPLHHFDGNIRSMGFYNTKNLILNGGVDSYTGEKMQGGSIILNGDADQIVGTHMEDGLITVNGNVGGGLGFGMDGGKIVVNGNAGNNVGEGMEGGEIHINGDYESLGEINGGKIFQNGNLIYKT